MTTIIRQSGEYAIVDLSTVPYIPTTIDDKVSAVCEKCGQVTYRLQNQKALIKDRGDLVLVHCINPKCECFELTRVIAYQKRIS